jgi:steroid delta-isomerase-like uncharacterized protein
VSERENKATFTAFVKEVWNGRSAAALDKYLAPGCVVHNLAGPDRPRDREGYRRGVVAVISGFPDIQETVEDLFAEGDRVAVRSTVRGTHKGEFAGMAPTGKSFAAAGSGIVRFAAGKIAEMWEFFDFQEMYRQLGVTPKQ